MEYNPKPKDIIMNSVKQTVNLAQWVLKSILTVKGDLECNTDIGRPSSQNRDDSCYERNTS